MTGVALPGWSAAGPSVVLAHGGELTGWHDVWSTWALDPLVLLAVVVTIWWYVAGLRAVWRSAGRGQVVSVTQAAAFGLAVAAIVVALVSPLDPLAEALFGAHMVQHVLLTLVAAPLFVLSSPLQTMAWGLPVGLRRGLGRWQGHLRRSLTSPGLPVMGLAVFTAVFTAWHVPPLYDAAIRNDAVHALEHATMLGAALLFWAPVLRPRRTHGGLGVVLLFLSLIASGVLAALLVFAPSPWYAHEATAAFGLTRLEDQQIAGAVMWVPGGAIYMVAGAAVLVRWLRSDEELTERRERGVPSHQH
jgi:putative membrane protein